MQTHSIIMKIKAAGAVLGLLLLSACGGGGQGAQGGSDAQADPTTQVAPGAASSAAVATSYTGSLAATPPATTDGLEPLPVPAALAADDTAEPV